MSHHVAYDITRLITRVLNATPNGIDRVDLAYAKHILSKGHTASALVHLGPIGHRQFDQMKGQAAIEGIMAHLGEMASETAKSRLGPIQSWLDGHTKKPAGNSNRTSKPSVARVANYYLNKLGIAGRSPARSLEKDSRYLCVSQYPLSVTGAFDWMKLRPDIKPVFFIHDLLPFQFPEYFKVSEHDRHERRMHNLAKHAAAALVSTEVVAHELRAEMVRRGRSSFPIHVSPMPMANSFQSAPSSAVARGNYFIMCGTIEPRKNHITILHVWRELAKELGPDTPKLILVGARGWENENTIDLLERSPSIREHVLELNGLSTSDLVALMTGAKAMLMPTFGEGYGLPLAEAISLGVPVIASDIPVFHEIAPDNFLPVHPVDGLGWRKAIVEACNSGSTNRPLPPKVARTQPKFTALDVFLETL